MEAILAAAAAVGSAVTVTTRAGLTTAHGDLSEDKSPYELEGVTSPYKRGQK